jgi:hypothetical protein
MKKERVWSIVLCAANLVVFIVGLSFTPNPIFMGISLVGYQPDYMHGWVLPHLLLAGLMALLLALGAMRWKHPKVLDSMGAILQPFLVITFWYAMNRPWGGDDGGYWFWVLFMGGATSIVLLVAATRQIARTATITAASTPDLKIPWHRVYGRILGLVAIAFTGWTIWAWLNLLLEL